jgi:hypothetical protein
MIVTSTNPLSAWDEIFGGEAAAAAMTDRLVHDAEDPLTPRATATGYPTQTSAPGQAPEGPRSGDRPPTASPPKAADALPTPRFSARAGIRPLHGSDMGPRRRPSRGDQRPARNQSRLETGRSASPTARLREACRPSGSAPGLVRPTSPASRLALTALESATHPDVRET